ncbi:hypothetical protein E2C01_100238 [Portunus trituberculatus]|uniref:Uncharacterized protein n=1 Tax=Portunus trituberculatus TaxID=210409 RepID=A0A5B7KCU1_PORTR|nr:hypothetical protein [Portunus trituberculatus]
MQKVLGQHGGDKHTTVKNGGFSLMGGQEHCEVRGCVGGMWPRGEQDMAAETIPPPSSTRQGRCGPRVSRKHEGWCLHLDTLLRERLHGVAWEAKASPGTPATCCSIFLYLAMPHVKEKEENISI